MDSATTQSVRSLEPELDMPCVSGDLLFQAALDGLYVGRDNKLLLVARDGRIVSMNRLLASFCGHPAGPVAGDIHVVDLFENDAAMSGGPDVQRWETSLRTTSGAAIPVEVVREPLGPLLPGAMVYAVRDLRERREAAAERARNLRALELYTAQLERSNAELQSFAYVVSHDLQEPLRKIETFASRILSRQQGALPPDLAHPLERITDAAKRMRALISDLLAYAKLGSETKPLGTVDLGRIAAGVLTDLQARIDETGATIHVEDLPRIEAEPALMRQLLQNLLANALKFSRPGVAPVVRISGCIEQSASGDMAVIQVADNGIGFPDSARDSLFKLFGRLNPKLAYEGTGVGLATCRKIAEHHGGTIDADGRPGEGATFIVRLPVKSARASTT